MYGKYLEKRQAERKYLFDGLDQSPTGVGQLQALIENLSNLLLLYPHWIPFHFLAALLVSRNSDVAVLEHLHISSSVKTKSCQLLC